LKSGFDDFSIARLNKRRCGDKTQLCAQFIHELRDLAAARFRYLDIFIVDQRQNSNREPLSHEHRHRPKQSRDHQADNKGNSDRQRHTPSHTRLPALRKEMGHL
jgi:hypothetical protein